MTKAAYVDGYVFSVPKAKTAAYKKLCLEAQKAWLKFGALDYKECMIEDSNPFKAKYTFNTIAKPKAGEVVWFSFVTYKSKADRNRINKQVMKYFEEKYPDMAKNMPFDYRRMAVGGFKVMVG